MNGNVPTPYDGSVLVFTYELQNPRQRRQRALAAAATWRGASEVRRSRYRECSLSTSTERETRYASQPDHTALPVRATQNFSRQRHRQDVLEASGEADLDQDQIESGEPVGSCWFATLLGEANFVDFGDDAPDTCVFEAVV
jgi:hypothetical protein